MVLLPFISKRSRSFELFLINFSTSEWRDVTLRLDFLFFLTLSDLKHLKKCPVTLFTGNEKIVIIIFLNLCANGEYAKR